MGTFLTALLDAHPRHATLGSVLRCPICMSTFWSQLARRRQLDEAAGR